MPEVAFCSAPELVSHTTGPHHPERPERLMAVHRALRQAGLLTSPDPFPDFEIDLGLAPLTTRPLLQVPASPCADEAILRVHPQSHLESLTAACRAAVRGTLDAQGDTPIGPRALEMARLSAGCGIGAVDAVLQGKAVRAFAAGRPPGHHAEPTRAMGFCLLSNIVIAARHAQHRYGVGRVAIVDFDVHHGNGTQACTEADPSILFVSLHQDPRTCYPGTGHPWETGEGAAAGTNLNLPLPPGSGDDDYIAAFHADVLPALDRFRPELLFISAGFDAHDQDPLASMSVTEGGFGRMTHLLAQSAGQHCQGHIVSLLEGGYHLKWMARSVVKHVLALADDSRAVSGN
jgi:acetoin utilization deacetylase AcuC-like enzyme